MSTLAMITGTGVGGEMKIVAVCNLVRSLNARDLLSYLQYGEYDNGSSNFEIVNVRVYIYIGG